MPVSFDPAAAREFAVDVVATLRAAGQQALWAGGCVRDQLLGRTPKDYDVATDAPPERVREIYGKRRTLPLGAAFGVITVLGPKSAGQIEVATFRRDLGYSDGRRPDAVAYSTAEEDAQRRDFTINGLFFDPLANEVIDYVGGREDLAAGVIRAIGVPAERFAEDKLRMLRAVRFTAAFDFVLDAATAEAIRAAASELTVVSPERIAAELRRMLEHPRRALAAELLAVTELLPEILPESRTLDAAAWSRTKLVLDRFEACDFATALAALVREMRTVSAGDFAALLAERWRLANDERDGVAWLLEQEALIRSAREVPWPRLQRVLAAPRCDELLQYADAVGDVAAAEYCRERIAGPCETWDPPPLLTGNDLIRAGFRPGPRFRTVLDEVRDAQLDGVVTSPAEALGLARTLFQAGS